MDNQNPLPQDLSPEQQDYFMSTDFSRVLKELLEDKDLTKTLEKHKDFPLWFPNSKSLKITFADNVDREIWENQFEAAICYYIRNISPEEYAKKAPLIMQLRMLFRANINRSVGTTNNLMNERIAQLTQIRHQTSQFSEKGGSGILGRVRNAFGR